MKPPEKLTPRSERRLLLVDPCFATILLRVDLEVVVQHNEQHARGPEEEGERVELGVGDHFPVIILERGVFVQNGWLRFEAMKEFLARADCSGRVCLVEGV